MNFDLTSILKAIGPAASIVFAAWIFMGFLQQRYDAAVERYQSMISQYRSGNLSDDRRGNIREEILVYKRRCELMNWASMVGIVSAILLIATLITGELNIIFPKVAPLKYLSAGSALLGFTLIIVAAIIVMVESSIIHRQLDSELLDVPDLAQATGQEGGDITTQKRRGRGLIGGPGWLRGR
jgi:hypothetical protein